jgi:hypothetical protein
LPRRRRRLKRRGRGLLRACLSLAFKLGVAAMGEQKKGLEPFSAGDDLGLRGTRVFVVVIARYVGSRVFDLRVRGVSPLVQIRVDARRLLGGSGDGLSDHHAIGFLLVCRGRRRRCCGCRFLTGRFVVLHI